MKRRSADAARSPEVIDPNPPPTGAYEEGFEARSLAVDLRATSYFKRDWRWIGLLVVLIAISVAIGLLEAWPIAVLIDSVLTQTPHGDWIHQLFLSVLPASKVGGSGSTTAT